MIGETIKTEYQDKSGIMIGMVIGADCIMNVNYEIVKIYETGFQSMSPRRQFKSLSEAHMHIANNYQLRADYKPVRKLDISDFSEQDEIDAAIRYERCTKCGNQYAANILKDCPICERKK